MGELSKFLIDFPMTIYATELIEADSYEEAKEKAERLLDSWDFFNERLFQDYGEKELLWENCDQPEVKQAHDADEVTLTDAQVKGYMSRGEG